MTYGVVHHIAHSSEWPSPVKAIAQIFERPLPTYLTTGPYPSVSPRASYLLQELSCDPRLPTIQENDVDADERPVTDVFDIVLSTVSDLRELAQLKDYGYPRPTVPLWSTLIKAVGHACSDDISIIGQVPFILPRIPRSAQWDSLSFDGIATVLLSHIVDKVDPHNHPSPARATDNERVSTNIRQPDDAIAVDEDEEKEKEKEKDKDKDEDVSMGYIHQISSKASNSSSIDVPFDAHVMPGHGRRFCAVLPLLCVADEENITPLLSSVLYQRHVWGIDEPAVGIFFSNTGTIGRVVLGWLDLESKDNQNLPSVNFSCGSIDIELTSDPSLGIFDLTDPFSALSFARFILGLKPHFRTLIAFTRDPKMRSLGWRSDHVPIDEEHLHKEPLEKRVIKWAHDIQMSDDSDDSSLLTPPASDLPLELSSSLSTGLSKSQSLTRLSGVASSLSSDLSQMATENKETNTPRIIVTESQHSTDKLGKTLSCSAFGAISAAGVNGKESISTWLFERRTITLGLIKLNDQGEEAQEINEKITFYHSMTKLLWPKEWTSVDKLPTADPSVEHVRRSLFKQYEENSKTMTEPIEETLDPAHLKIVEGRFSSLLQAVIGAFSKWAVSKGRDINELEARHDWDAILYRFYVSHDETVSPHVLLEKTLNLSRNKAADGDDPRTVLDSQRKLAREYWTLCSNAQLSSSYDAADDATDQALAASVQANAFLKDLGSLQHGPDFLPRIKEHAAAEPRTGKCDAIFVTPVSRGTGTGPRPGEAKDYPEAFVILKSASGNRTRSSIPANDIDNLAPSNSSSHLSPIPASQPENRSLSVDQQIPVTSQLSEFKQKNFLTNPFSVPYKDKKSTLDLCPTTEIWAFDSDYLLLSGFVAEYKALNKNTAQVLNQERMYLVSLITFLAALGIEEFPVFGLITNGQTGGILMGWKSRRQNKIYIIERNIRTFDLYSPIEAFRFALFILRLKDHTNGLKDLFESRVVAREKTSHGWSKTQQIEELKGLQ